MKKANWIFLALLIFIIYLSGSIFINCYTTSNYYRFYKDEVSLYPKSFSMDDPNQYEYIDKCDSVDDAKESIGVSVLKEYSVDENVYILVSKGWESADSVVVCYRYNTASKELYKVVSDYCFVESFGKSPICDADWYDDYLAASLVRGSKGNCYYIAQSSNEAETIGDVYYGTWFGDEVKNISFEKGKFEYTLLGEYNGENVYLCTYELKDSVEILNQAIIKDGEGYRYNTNDAKELLGIKCEYTFDKRIIIYWIIIGVLIVLSIFAIVKTVMLNQKVEGCTVSKVLFCIISVLLCCITTLLITYFIYNPRLVFGSDLCGLVRSVTGFSLPNHHEMRDVYVGEFLVD